MEPCDLDLFIEKKTQNLYSKKIIEDLKNRTQYYLCPTKTFRMLFSPNNLSGDRIYLITYISFANISILTQATYQISQIRPRATLIYLNILINSDNKTDPLNYLLITFGLILTIKYQKK